MGVVFDQLLEIFQRNYPYKQQYCSSYILLSRVGENTYIDEKSEFIK